MTSKRINAIVTIGGGITGSLGAALDTAKGKIGKVGAAVQKLEREQRALNRQIHSYAGYGKQGIDQLIAKHGAVTKQLQQQRRLMADQQRMASAKAGIADVGTALGVAGAIVGAGMVPVMEAIKFEKAMLGVAKQVDGARDSSGRLTSVYFEMAKQIQMLGREVPMSTEAIAEMVAAGARMGVAKDELIDFTRTAAMMSEAFDIPAGELAEQMGKIKGLFGLKTQGEVRALADSINYLDDNAISKGGDIIEFMQRVGGVAGSVKISGRQMAALGSTLLTLGERTETAGTAVNAMVQKFASAESGTKKFKAAMKQIGLSTKAVQKGMQVDAQGTIMKVMAAVNKLPKDQRLGVMVQLVGLEHSDTLAKLAGNVEEYRRQIDLANSQKAEGSMSREFQARMQTTSAQWEIMKNQASELGVNIGSVLLPALNQLLADVGPIVSKTADWVRENKELVGTILSVAGAMAKISLSPAGATRVMRDGVLWGLNKLGVDVGGTASGGAEANMSVEPPNMSAMPPALPAINKSGGSTTVVHSADQYNFKLEQKPGQSAEEMAHKVANVLERRDAVKKRSSTVDAGVQ